MNRKDVQLTEKPKSRASELRASASGGFDDMLQVWITTPEQGFAAWIEAQEFSRGSKVVYTSMWNKFSRWLDDRGIKLDCCDHTAVQVFLDSTGLTKEHRQRYVRLVERVFGHLQRLGLQMQNPGSKAAKERVGAGANDPMKFLDRADRERIIRCIAAVCGRAERNIGGDRPVATKDYWVATRDAAVAALMLGGGVKVSEVPLLTVNCTIVGDVLDIPAGEHTREHRAYLYPFAREALSAWVGIRSALPVSGGALFPADLGRRRSDRQVPTAAMHPATLFRRIKSLLSEAGISGERCGGQTLRNTYAAMLIEDGRDDEYLIECMGIFKGDYADLSIHRLREAHARWLRSRTAKEMTDSEKARVRGASPTS